MSVGLSNINIIKLCLKLQSKFSKATAFAYVITRLVQKKCGKNHLVVDETDSFQLGPIIKFSCYSQKTRFSQVNFQPNL